MTSTPIDRPNDPQPAKEASVVGSIPPLKVLEVDKFLRRFGGAAVYMLDLGTQLQRRGHEVEFFSAAHPDNLPATYEHLFPAVDDYDPPPDGLSRKLRAGAGMFWSRPAARAMAAVLDQFQPDIVHVHNIYHQLSPSILSPIRERGIPIVMTLHDFKLICPTYRMHDGRGSCEACLGGGFQNAVLRRCQSGSVVNSAVLASETAFHRKIGAYDAVDRFVCPSMFLHDKLLEAGFEPGRLQHIPNFSSAPLATNPHAPGGDVLSLGRLSQEKGIDTLIRACALAPARRLRIAGEGPLSGALRQLADELAVSTTAFLGQLDGPEVLDELDHAGVVVFPARGYENMPLAIVEAMARRVPVVVTDIGGSPEIVSGGGGGLTVPPDDPVALRQAIDRFDDPVLAAELGDDGVRRVRERFTPEVVLPQIERLYAELTAQRPHDEYERDSAKLSGVSVTLESPRRRSGSARRPNGGKLRVAMVGQQGIPAIHGGVERAVEELSARLVERGHEVTVFNRREHRGQQVEEYRGIRLVPVPATRGKYSGNLTQSLSGTLWTAGRDFDVVHFHAMGPCLWSPLARVGGNAAVVATVQGRDDQRAKWGLAARLSLKTAAWASAHVPHEVIVVSRQLGGEYADDFQRATHHIPNGVTPADTTWQANTDVLDRFGLRGQPYLVNVGRLVPEKAMDQAIRAFKLVDTDARLVIVGGSSHTGEYVERLEELASQDERVVLTGPLYGDDLSGLFGHATAYVMPSLLEGLPLALLEAVSYRLPLIVSDIEPHLDVVKSDGLAHRVFRAGDIEDMALAMKRTLDDVPYSSDACRQLEERVAKEFSWDRITTLTEEVYREAMDRAAGGIRWPSWSLRSSR
jgi:glycosyltransferase involved in cell wall biosynthesis